MKKTSFLILLVGMMYYLTFCGPGHKNDNFQPEGLWAFLDDTNSYYEAMFKNEMVTFQSDALGKVGPFKYFIVDDSLYYFNLKYAIYNIECNTFTLTSNNYKILLEKINIVDQRSDSNYYDPFFLRRCNFLVSRGLISMSDALEYLCKVDSKMDSIQEFVIETK
jgi:hypothetical protein